MRVKIAEYVHEIFYRWMEYLFENAISNSNGTVTLSKELVLKWKLYMWKHRTVPYPAIPIADRETDLLKATHILSIICDAWEVEEECPNKEFHWYSNPIGGDDKEVPCHICGFTGQHNSSDKHIRPATWEDMNEAIEDVFSHGGYSGKFKLVKGYFEFKLTSGGSLRKKR